MTTTAELDFQEAGVAAAAMPAFATLASPFGCWSDIVAWVSRTRTFFSFIPV